MCSAVSAVDPSIVSLYDKDGSVFISPVLQGRVFCTLDGEWIHRLDLECMKNARSGEFCNIGGNSLWPAPEGGSFAFNYVPPDTNRWQVQEAINSVSAVCVKQTPESVSLEKSISLLNRNGFEMKVLWRRNIALANVSAMAEKYSLKAVSYDSVDSLQLMEPCLRENAVIAAWSLEQFPLTEKAFAFIAFSGDAATGVNCGYYGDPSPFLHSVGDQVFFDFSAPERLQIGANVKNKPRFIGAFLPEKNLLIIRNTKLVENGSYIDIADNAQPDGPYGASDVYSIFYGGGLGFFELETIAPVMMDSDRVTGSTLRSSTMIFQGSTEALGNLMKQEFQFNLFQRGIK